MKGGYVLAAVSVAACLPLGALIGRLRGRWWLAGIAFWWLLERITEPLWMAREPRRNDDQDG